MTPRVREIFYCFGCMGECKGIKHTPPPVTDATHYQMVLPYAFRGSYLIIDSAEKKNVLTSFRVGHMKQLCGSVPVEFFQSPFGPSSFPLIGNAYQNKMRILGQSARLSLSTVQPHFPIDFQFTHPIQELGMIGDTNA